MFVKNVLSWERTDLGYVVHTASADALLVFMSDDVIRVRVDFAKTFTERSYALVTTAWDDQLDEVLKDERTRIQPLQVEALESEDMVEFRTAHLCLTMKKSPLSFSLTDLTTGEVIYRDLAERAFDKDHLGRLTHYSCIDPSADHFYGFGETTGHVDKKGRQLRFCPKDSIGHDPQWGAPLYKHIPFYVRVNENKLKYLGLFYNNSYDAYFDLGNERSGYWDPYCYYQTDGGSLDIFFIYGPSLPEVLERYTWLTGRSAMPTMQSLGFTASTMYYAELERNCDEEIYRVIKQHDAAKINIDNFWLASGYSAGEKDRLRYTFNWNYQRFPEPQEFFKRLNKQGINVIPNLKPGVLQHHPYLGYYYEQDALVKLPAAEEAAAVAAGESPYYVGRWWGGPGNFVDFTGPKGRQAWTKLLQEKILGYGATTVWNDNCEYDGVEDRNAQVAAEGLGGTMAEYKIIQSNMMAYTAKHALAETYPNERPYIINRAGYAGIQRYAQVWGGDNLTAWATLKFNVATILGMGLSGVANMGCDIGGFAGPAPEGELLLRWIQNGVFQPRFTMNSANNDNTVTQPWMYPEYLPEIQAAYALRYRHLIYLYALMREAYLTGAPAWRTLFYEFPEDKNCLTDQNLSFMFGPSILVANVLEKGQTERPIYLPAGTTWYDLNDHLRPYQGGQTIYYPVNSHSIPMFLRDNAIVITSPDIQRIVRDKVKLLELTIAATGSQATGSQTSASTATASTAAGAAKPLTFNYYEDDGHSKDFEQGVYANTKITVTPGEVMKIDFTKTGTYKHSYERLALSVVSPQKGALEVFVAGEQLPRFLVPTDFAQSDKGWFYDLQRRTIEVKCPRPQEDNFTILVSTKHFDLIGMENNG